MADIVGDQVTEPNDISDTVTRRYIYRYVSPGQVLHEYLFFVRKSGISVGPEWHNRQR